MRPAAIAASRAVGDALQRRGEAGRQLDFETVRASGRRRARARFRVKVLWTPALLSVTPAARLGSNGRVRARARRCRPGRWSRVKNWVEVWFGSSSSPGDEFGVDGEGAAVGRSRQQAAFGAEEVQVEFREGRLRQVLEADRRGGRCSGSAMDAAGELHVGGEAVGGDDQPVAVAGLRVAEVDRPGQRPRAAPGCLQDERSDLRGLRALRFEFGAELRLRRRCRSSCRRRRWG